MCQDVKEILQRYKELQDIIAILGMDELSDEDKLSLYIEQEEFKDSYLNHSMLQNSLQDFRVFL